MPEPTIATFQQWMRDMEKRMTRQERRPGGNVPGVPAGVSASFRGSTVPDGWLWEDGSEVGRNDYAELFEAIGETYGAGDGSTTFNLPDSRFRIELGADDDDFEVGDTGGSATLWAPITWGAGGQIQFRRITSGSPSYGYTVKSASATAVPISGETGVVSSQIPIIGSDQSVDTPGATYPPFLVCKRIIKF